MAARTIESVRSDYENFVFKFGSGEVGTSFTAIADDGVTDTAFLSTPDKALISSASVDDIISGSGGYKVQVSGLDENLLKTSEFIVLNGTTAVETANTYSIIYRMRFITQDGTVATNDGSAFTGPNHGAITAVDKTTGLITMAQIGSTNGQTLMCLWQCPLDEWGELLDVDYYVPSAKIVDLLLLYQVYGTDAWNVGGKASGIGSQVEKFFKRPQLIVPGTKLMAVAKVDSSTVEIDCTFELETFKLDQGVS